MGNNLLRFMDDGDAAAKTSEHLTEFQTNVSSTEDDQVLGERR